jgi:hypothetical protein
MTDPIPLIDRRDALRAKIDAAARRNEQRNLADQARAAASAAVDYTRAHPLTVIGAAVALGIAIGLLTKPGRRLAAQAASSTGGAVSHAAASAGSGVKGLAARGGSRIGALVGEAALAYVMTLIDDAIEAARSGQGRAEELGEAAGAQARKLRSGAGEAAETAVDGTRALARKTRDAALGAVRDIARKAKR